MVEADLEANIKSLTERMQSAATGAGRKVDEITLVAVSKTFPTDRIVQARSFGINHFGENRVEEARLKIPIVAQDNGPPVTWHLVGHVQRRKVKEAVRLFDIIHSVDTVSVALEIDKHARRVNRRVPVLLEINVSGEKTKFGFPAEPREELYIAVAQVLNLGNIDVQGLMTIAPIVERPEHARPFFRSLRELLYALRIQFPARNLNELSMGMSDDFEAAIVEGATMIRIGRALFGTRL